MLGALAPLMLAFALPWLATAAEPLHGFPAVVAGQLKNTLGADALPTGQGTPLVGGMLVTIDPRQVQIFDHEAFPLVSPDEGRTSTACQSGCASSYFQQFQWAWLRAAVESASLGTEISTTVHVAAHRETPARAVIEVAYAVAESRPVGPPNLSFVVDGGGRGLQSQPFFLLPPRGLRLQAGAAALGLTIAIDGAQFVVAGADSSLGRGIRVQTVPQLVTLVTQLKKKYPSKNALILVPDGSMRMGELLELIAQVHGPFERVVLSLGQPLSF